MVRRFIATFLVFVMIIGLSKVEVKASGLIGSEEYDLSKCVLYAQDNSEAIIINASNVSVNGDIISGGNITINSQGRNVNGTIYDNQDIYMLRLLPNIERQYLEDSDYYEEYVSETFNENINKSRYISDSFQCENMLSINNSAVVTGGDIVVNNQVTNMNNAILCSIIGDIHIESNNVSVDGIVYAPMGTVYISGDNVNISGNIIAQKIEIIGRYNVNINKKPGKLDALQAEVPSAVKYGAEDTDEIYIGELYCKDISSDDDIIYVGDGIYCVKNQILLSVEENVPFSTVRDLVNNYDANIVGYIELTNDYQIEIEHDVEVDELIEIKDSLAGMPYILSADYNILEENDKFHTNDTLWYFDWDEKTRAGKDVVAETIKLKSALIKCGVIENDTTLSEDINTSMLYNVKIGIIDSGFDEWNPEGDITYTKVWNNYDSLYDLKHTKKNADGTYKTDAHGTLCAGVMAAGFNNSRGIAGVCVKNRLYAFSKNSPNKSDSKSKNGIFNEKYALALLIGNNVRVISRSLGSYTTFQASIGNINAINDTKDEAAQLCAFLEKLIDKGYDFIIVNAAGNENSDRYYKVKHEEEYKYGYISEELYWESPEDYTDINTEVTYGPMNSDAKIKSFDGTPIVSNAKYGSAYACIEKSIVRNRIVIVGAMSSHKLSSRNIFDGKMCDFSNLGSRVDICALGENVWSCAVKGEGEDVTLPDGTIVSGYVGKGRGTSVAAPQVAGALGLAYSVNPAIDSLTLVNILKNKYTDYKSNKDDNYFHIKYVNAEELVTGAIDYSKIYSNPHTMNNIYDGMIIGSVAEYNSDGTEKVLNDVKVAVQKMDDSGTVLVNDLDKIIEKTDTQGMYMINIPSGQYRLMFEKEGYYSVSLYANVIPEATTNMNRVYLIPCKPEDIGETTIKGHVVDATNGNPIVGATIRYKEGWDNRYGNNIGTFIFNKESLTNNEGVYYVELPIGVYTAEITKEGYYTAYTNIIVAPGGYEAYSVMSPETAENEYRVVLTWGEFPYDLDSHLEGTLEGTSLHVSYINKNIYQGNIKIASLDYDDVDGYGPETITFTINSANDTIKYYVHDYSNGGDSSSYELSYSNAKVTIYSGDISSKPVVYNVPIGKQGTRWYVFEIKDKIIKEINRIE